MGIFGRIFGRKETTGARPSFEGVQTGSRSTLGQPETPAAKSAPARPAAVEPRVYEVKAGDSLSKIARQFYGNANEWRKIYDANRDQIKNPDLIQPGQRLTIP